MTSLVRTFGISRLWLLETELWPAMLWVCIRRNIPVGIANGRIEEKSFTPYRRMRWIFGPLLAQFDVVLAQNEIYAGRFSRLGVRPERLHVVGNMKGHIIFHRASPAEREALRHSMGLTEKDVVLAAGCFHQGEGTLLRESADALREKGRSIKIIAVPRYLDESNSLAAELGNGALRLTDVVAQAGWDVCIVEKLGILESVYSIADAAVIGGTFVTIGGHNVWEAAKYCIPVFFGPHYHTQVSGCEKLLAAGTGFCVANARELGNGLERALWLEKEAFAAAESLFVEEVNRSQMIAEPIIS